MKTTLKCLLEGAELPLGDDTFPGLPPLGDSAAYYLAASWAVPLLADRSGLEYVHLEYIFENDGDLPFRVARREEIGDLRNMVDDPIRAHPSKPSHQKGGPYDGWPISFYGSWLIATETEGAAS